MNQTTATAWVNTYGLTYFVGWDQGGSVWSMYGEGYIPHNVIIGQDGKVLYTEYGYNITTFQNIINAELEKVPAEPENLAITSRRPVEIDLAWSANSEGDIAGYQITYEKVGKTGSRSVADAGNVTNYTVTGLDLQTEYEFSLRAYDHRGHYSESSASTTGSTIGMVPELSSLGILALLMAFTALTFLYSRRRNAIRSGQ